ncbi:IPT/TIG domain-containing protein [Stenotrophomonas sp. 364]|uniref:IPT/TIG domain-containing protein n=1 Tax=Stenotrophomonas sp. 364 TaxID=2691571 RepID=UPI0013162F64|nr:IPT/TIG domain-containing protein [Stenotrophomonas sp. 364]QHB73091.1 autotransporter domain-containing protein [Stenotrophomonas sp. 364]
MPTARAASFNESFSSPPSGVPVNTGGPGVASFQMTLGGDVFVFTAPTNAFVWETGAGLLVNNSIPQLTIRRLDNAPFVLNTLGFNGDFGPDFPVTVRVMRNGSEVTQQLITPFFYGVQSYSAVEVDEIRMTGSDLLGVTFNGFAGNSQATAAAPTVTSVSPTAGPPGGGNTLLITGTGFTGATAVTFGGQAALGYAVDSATQIRAEAPAGSGTVNVRVTTAGGTSATSAANQYSYAAAPVITAVSPTSGPGAGGTTVILTGSNFSGATAVTFGANAATGYTVNSATQITATAPAGTGTVDIRVTTAGGTSATSAADQFTYVSAPTVTSVSPTAGPPGGGNTLLITGTGFTGATAVTFGGQAALGYAVDSATQIRAEAPAGSGTVNVRVTTAGGTSATSAANQYSYAAAPVITAVSPTSGPGAGGTTVILTGSNFSGATAVTFGANAATGYTVNSATQITATAPAGTGTVDIRVTTVGGTSATSAADQFTYVSAPTVTSVSPTAGPPGGGNTLLITGTGFTGATAVTFGGQAALGYAVDSATQIRAEAPAGSGTVNVRVTTAGGTSATGAANQYSYAAAPVITAVSPTSGPGAGGTTVILTGSNFSGATAVTFGANAAAGYTVNSATQITATAPAGTGTVDIRVTTAGGTSATSAADQFTYVSAPTVTSVSPTAGPPGGGNTLLITGTGFTGATAVTFGGQAALGYAVDSATQIRAEAPAGSGTVNVRVTTSGGTSATSAANQYSYAAAPVITAVSPTSGPGAGGTTVTLTGSNFSGATAVTFGANAATGYTVNSTTQITATAPAGTGTVDIRVTTVGGISATSAADQFTYVAAPTVTSLSPAIGPTAGGTTVVITGVNLAGTTAVVFGTTPASAFIVNSSTQITASAPANAAGTLNVRVVTAGGVSADGVGSEYRYVSAPVASSFTYPSEVPYNAGGNLPLAFNLASQASNSPTAFAVTSATTTLGGSVSIDAVGQVSYVAPVGRRAVNDSFQYTASNGGGTSAPATVTLALGNPTLTAALTGNGVHGVALSVAAISVSGGRAPYTCAAMPVSGTLPAGVQLNADCSLSGTPTQSGSFTFAAEITDSSSAAFTAASSPLTLAISASVPSAPSIGTATFSGTGAVTVTFSAPVSDGGAAITQYTVTAHPGGAYVTGSGSPLTVTGLTAGTGYTFTVTATNAAGTSVGSAPSNTATPIAALVAGPVNATIPYGASATPIALVINGVPATVAVVDAPAHGTAVISGNGIQYTPHPGYAGADRFSYRASDAFSTSAPADVSITVAPPTVALTQATLAEGSTSAAYSQTLQATGGAEPYTFAVTAGALPAGIALQSDGTLSGRATVAGTFAFAVTVTDSSTGEGPFTANRSYSLVIAAPSVVLDLPTLPDADGAQSYTQQLTASGGTAPYRFALRAGRLPTGLALSESGAVSGEPTEAGTFAFEVQVTDANGFGGNRAYTFVVQSAAQAIAAFVATPDAPVYRPGGTFTVSASGGASGQPVLFASASPSVCSVQGGTVTMLAAGTCALTADQAGNGLYAAAPQRRMDVVIAAATPVITWVENLSKVYGEDAFELQAPQSNSPGAFTFTSSNTAVATVNGRTVTLQGEGTTTITAAQAASAGYAAASVQVKLVVAGRPDPTQDPQVVSSLQAQVDATVRFAQVQQANVRDRLRQVRTGTNASSMNVVLAYAGGNGQQGLSVPVGNGLLDAPALPQGWGTWAAGTLSFGSVGRGRTSADFNTGGITVGADRALGENVLLGVAGSWGRQDTSFDGSPSTTDADQRSLALYGLWRSGEHVFIDAMLAAGKLDFSMTRWSELAAASARSSRAGDQLFGSLTFGYEHRTATGATFTTYGRYDGHKAELDPYREHGLGVYDLSYGRQDVESSVVALGLEGTHAFKSDRVTWRPHWSVEYRTALDDRSDVAMNYVQRPVARDYLLAMHSYNDDTLSVGAGVDLQWDSGWMFSLLIGHDQGRNTLSSNSIGLQVRYGSRSSAPTVRSRPQGNDLLGAAQAQPGCADTPAGCVSATVPREGMTGAR